MSAVQEVVASAQRPVDRSGSIALGGTAQTLMPPNTARRGFFIQNTSAADLWVSELGNAAIGGSSIKVVAGATLSSDMSWNPVSAISVYGATTGQTFSARES